MSNRPKSPPKSPFQSNRGTPLDFSTEVIMCVPVEQATPASSQTRNDRPSNPSKIRMVATPSQSQKHSAHTTPTNSTVCIPRDKASAVSTPSNSLACVPKTSSKTLSGSASYTTQRPPSARDKTASQFNPIATSTPRSSQMRLPPWQTSSSTYTQSKRPQSFSAIPPRQGVSICPPCSPCPTVKTESQNARPVSTPVESKGCPFPGTATGTMCQCVPENAAPAASEQRAPEGVKKARLLKIEILSVKGGDLYDVDKIPAVSRTPTLEYDPRYDVDQVVRFKAEEGKDTERKSVTIKKEYDVTEVCQPSAEESTLRGDTDVTLTPDSTVKGAEHDESGDIRSAPAAPASYHVSEISQTDMPPVKEEKEDDAMSMSLHVGEQPSVSLGDYNLPVGEVSEPGGKLDLSAIPDRDPSKRTKTRPSRDEDAATKAEAGGARVKVEDETKAEAGGARVKVEDETKAEAGGARVKVEDETKAEAGGARVKVEDETKAEAGGARVKVEDETKAEAGGARVKVEDETKAEVGGASVKVEDETQAEAGGASVKVEDETKAEAGGARVKVEDESAKVKVEGGGAGVKDEPSGAQRTANEQALEDAMTDEGRRSFSLILGPSVRNFARLAASPLVALRAMLGPAPIGRPIRHARRKQFGRYYDEPNPPENARIRSVRSALVVTPYGASASSFAFLLGGRAGRWNTTRNVRAEESSQSESSSDELE